MARTIVQWAPGSTVLLLALLSMPALAQSERIHRYVVSMESDLKTMRVDACFAGEPPKELVVESLDAPGAFVEGKAVERKRPIAPNGTEMVLRDVPADGCIQYSVNLTGNQTRHDFSGNSTKRIGRDLFTEVGLWFWRPSELTNSENIEVEFALPEGVGVSAPWKPVKTDSGRPAYRVGRGAWDRPSAIAFGYFKEELVEIPGATLRLAVLDGTPKPDYDGMRKWIVDAAQSVAAIYGKFPVPSPQVLVMPGARASEPTPWAYVLRGGQAAAHFFVNQRRPLREYIEDWTAPHELSHLLLPYVTSNDAWLSEGLATYYQNVARARSGAITAQDAWQRMHSGFRRGKDGTNGKQSLQQATERMYRDGGYMRIYWSGAAMLMMADVRLRQLSEGKQSLDTVLAKFAACCLDPDPEWTAKQVFAKFDELAGVTVFMPLYDAHVSSTDFPDLSKTYEEIGLQGLGGKLEMKNSAPSIAIRDAIMAPGSYRTPPELLGSSTVH